MIELFLTKTNRFSDKQRIGEFIMLSRSHFLAPPIYLCYTYETFQFTSFNKITRKISSNNGLELKQRLIF